MGIGSRVFFLTPDGFVYRIPCCRFDRLWNDDPVESFPEYSGNTVRCVIAYIQFRDRQPEAVEHLDFLMIPFDELGKIDHWQMACERCLSRDDFCIPEKEMKRNNLMDIRPFLAEQVFDRDRVWSPTHDQYNRIIYSALS